MSLRIHILRSIILSVAPAFCFSSRAEQLPLKLYSSADGLVTGAPSRYGEFL